MPGWAIVADLTPPELIARARSPCCARSSPALPLWSCCALPVTSIRPALYGAASDAANSASDSTIALQHATIKYAPVTQIETAVDSIRGEVATLMANDVDVPAVVAAIRGALPNTMTINSMTLTLTPAGSGATVGLDASGRPVIGSVSITGSGRTLDDLPTFVDRLSAIKGVVNVLPNSNQVSNSLAQFNVTISLNDQLYTHRYDLVNTGGK